MEENVQEEQALHKEQEDKLTLGGGIELVGFKEIDFGSMVILKKMVGGYVRKFSDENQGFEKLIVKLVDKKKIHVELMISGKSKVMEAEANNLFVSLDKALKGL